MSSSEPRELLGIDPSELRFACAFSPPACFSRFDSVFAVIFSSFYGFPDGFHSENASFLCGADFGVSLLLFFLHFEVLFTRTFWRLPNLWPYLFPLFPNFPSFCFLRSFDRAVELKKQISCTLHLTNRTDEYVAFKVTESFRLPFICLPQNLSINFEVLFYLRQLLRFC
jgi:hypothetical protein